MEPKIDSIHFILWSKVKKGKKKIENDVFKKKGPDLLFINSKQYMAYKKNCATYFA